jgi:hypothetical protein
VQGLLRSPILIFDLGGEVHLTIKNQIKVCIYIGFVMILDEAFYIVEERVNKIYVTILKKENFGGTAQNKTYKNEIKF